MNQVELNDADKDTVDIKCACGNTFDFPRDALFALKDLNCGQCGQSGLLKVVRPPTEKQR